ncbi:hypothetical protein HYE82_22270 [Streptomyces sp. BR123]|uniref:hypothetical protein n=1 Tax=Streptomyces sp. BR123 TaxID=2749828 RepID=UPI0015C4C70F|nr:hypothetical protein [Streptomyces sp. BR123]NXY97056.1 hypothetical protein [Streptomyces sp. BR123]
MEEQEDACDANVNANANGNGNGHVGGGPADPGGRRYGNPRTAGKRREGAGIRQCL